MSRTALIAAPLLFPASTLADPRTIRHPARVNKLVAASVAYDLRGWQPEFVAFIKGVTPKGFFETGTP